MASCVHCANVPGVSNNLQSVDWLPVTDFLVLVYWVMEVKMKLAILMILVCLALAYMWAKAYRN